MAQVSQRNDFTSRLIGQHIRPGMRVLDVGCGSGDATFLLAEAVDDSGKVEGVDVSPAAIDAAQKRQDSAGVKNVAFSVADVNTLAAGTSVDRAHDTRSIGNTAIIGDGPYDAIFGRRVLMYQPDPGQTVRTLKRLLKPGGILLFQESDEAGSRLNGDELPLHNQAQEWIWQTVRFEGGHTHIGSELYGIMKAAGLRVTDYRTEAVLQTVESGSDLAWVVSMMEARMRAAGIDARAEGLEGRLTEEMQHANRAFVRDLAYGICAEKH